MDGLLTSGERVFLTVFLVGFIAFGVWADRRDKKNTICNTGEVIDIGGCDRNGACVVRLDNDFVGMARYPLKGNKFEACKWKE